MSVKLEIASAGRTVRVERDREREKSMGPLGDTLAKLGLEDLCRINY